MKTARLLPNNRRLAAIVSGVLALAAAPACFPAGPAPAPPAPAVADDSDEFDEYAVPRVSDPFERVNRTIFKFNDSAYRHVLRPVAHGYEKAVPRPVRRGIGNFFDNLAFPVRFTGSALQGKFDRSAAEAGKFLVNTTVGIAGLIRVSDEFPELQVPPEDVGQALGSWGLRQGPFLVIPILGPTTIRDLVGRSGDSALNPVNWTFIEGYDWRLRTGLQATDSVNGLPTILETYDSLRQSALDPYVALRNGYLQYREAAVKQ